MDLPDLDKPCLYPGDSLTPWPQHKGIEALKALLPKIRYKKGWHFRLEPITYHSDYLDLDNFRNAASGSTHRLTIHYIAPDAYAPDEPRAQQFTVMIPNTNGYPYGDDMLPCPDEDAWARWLFRIIVYLEEHEAAEFFLVDGKRTFDPHAPGFRSLVGLPTVVD